MNEDSYRKKLNIPDASFARIDHEDAMVAEVFKVTRPSGSESCKDMYRASSTGLQLAQALPKKISALGNVESGPQILIARGPS